MTRASRHLSTLLVVCAVVVAGGCSTGDDTGTAPTPSGPPTTGLPSASPDSSSSPSATATEDRPVQFEAARAMRTVRQLAGRIGPREATTGAYRQAAAEVHATFARLGYDVTRQRLEVPAGNSWGVPVPAGRTTNVIATPDGYRPGDRYLILGAHLDTVPQAPGAEDNASGVSVLLELARVAARQETRLPVVFVAFGAEEPRGEGDDWHHFGSQAYTARMSPEQRRTMVAMVSLDRVGVGSAVPVCGGGVMDRRVVSKLRRAARRANVATTSRAKAS